MIIKQYCENMNDVDLIISPSGIGEVPPKIKDIMENENKD